MFVSAAVCREDRLVGVPPAGASLDSFSFLALSTALVIALAAVASCRGVYASMHACTAGGGDGEVNACRQDWAGLMACVKLAAWLAWRCHAHPQLRQLGLIACNALSPLLLESLLAGWLVFVAGHLTPAHTEEWGGL